MKRIAELTEYCRRNPSFILYRYVAWILLGVTYATLYMARYNLAVCQSVLKVDLMPMSYFGEIFALGAMTYGLGFFATGPITDKLGGKFSIMLSMIGSFCANVFMAYNLGQLIVGGHPDPVAIKNMILVAYAVNMLFQSFGAVSIVKINAAWFHFKERGVFGGVFGLMIAAGIFLAYDVNEFILKTLQGNGMSKLESAPYVFWAPSALLGVLIIVGFFVLKNSPKHAGYEKLDTGDQSSLEKDEPVKVTQILARILTDPLILVIALVQFCNGVSRNAAINWSKTLSGFHIETLHEAGGWLFLKSHMGLVLLIAGFGSLFAGWLSDKVFSHRRLPVAGILFAMAAVAGIALFFSMDNGWLFGGVIFVLAFAGLGIQGMLSGTASADFGGGKRTGTAVGLIDGFVYAGASLQSYYIGILSKESWLLWPVFVLPFTFLGLVLCIRIWNAIPDPKHPRTPVPFLGRLLKRWLPEELASQTRWW